jgi:hypothetical protein
VARFSALANLWASNWASYCSLVTSTGLYVQRPSHDAYRDPWPSQIVSGGGCCASSLGQVLQRSLAYSLAGERKGGTGPRVPHLATDPDARVISGHPPDPETSIFRYRSGPPVPHMSASSAAIGHTRDECCWPCLYVRSGCSCCIRRLPSRHSCCHIGTAAQLVHRRGLYPYGCRSCVFCARSRSCHVPHRLGRAKAGGACESSSSLIAMLTDHGD